MPRQPNSKVFELTEDYSLKLNFTNAVIDVDGGERLGSWSASP
jgi:hypothetical protein